MPPHPPGLPLASLCLAALGLAWAGSASGAAIAPTPGADPPLATVVEHLGDADRAGREDLAWIALSEMLDAYEQMLDGIGQAGRAGAESPAKGRWRASAGGFLGRLRAELHAVESGASIVLDTEPDGALLVLVDGRPTLVSGPDLADPAALGRRIVATFCASHACPAPQPEPTAPGAPASPAPLGVSTGHWSFADNRATRFETREGIAFEFSGFQDRTRKQEASDQLSAELRLLARGLGDIQSLGRRIDWEILRVVPTPDGQDPRVVLNRDGDFLYLPIPGLARHPELLEEARPWIQARMEGRPYELVLTRAERLVRTSEGAGAPAE